jgi:hypothetical protein
MVKYQLSKFALFSIALIIVIVIIAAFIGIKKLTVYTDFDTTLILFRDIRIFSVEHNNTLPQDWEEFIMWHNQKKSTMCWKKADLEKRFTLRWGAHVKDLKDDSIILEVHDPVLQKYSESLNKTFIRRLTGTQTDKNGL